MRRETRNDNVLRAIAMALATMITVTATPVTALASAGDGNPNEGTDGDGTPSQVQQAPLRAEDVVQKAADTVTEAQEYTGTLKEGENKASGEIGTKAQEALDDVAKAEDAVKAQNTLAEAAAGVNEAMDLLLADGKPGDNGKAQIKKAESNEKTVEKNFGVELNEKGEVVKRTGLDDKISGANNAIDVVNGTNETIGKKEAAESALKEVESQISTADGLIGTAEGAQSDADTFTSTANAAIANKASIDKETQNKLDDIKATLAAAVVEDDITKAVEAAADASSAALNVAGDQLTTVAQKLQDAADAADDAENHSASYNQQQMSNLAKSAQDAADTAQKAVTAANEALKTAKQKEAEAAKAVSNAQEALNKAQGDAAEVLREYKEQLDAINASITEANGYRADAVNAMKAANDAIDAALKLMDDPAETVEDAKKKVEEMNKAISAATTAIEKVTGLSFVVEKDKDAKKTLKTATQRVDGQITALSNAQQTYNDTIAKTGTVEANRQAAVTLYNELTGLVNKVDGKDTAYDQWRSDIDGYIQDLKALLSTNGAYTYQQLSDKAAEMEGALGDAADALEGFVNENKVFGDDEENQNLTADQILAKYNELDNEKSDLNSMLNGKLKNDIEEQEGIIAECNSQGSLKTEKDNAYGILRQTEDALNSKYVYEPNENGEYVFKTDDQGKRILNSKYQDLVTASEETEYRCGDEVLSPTAKPAYTDEEGSKYVIDGDETIPVPTWILSDKDKVVCNVQKGGCEPVALDADAEKLTQIVSVEYQEDYNKGDSVFRNANYRSIKAKKVDIDTYMDVSKQNDEVRRVILASVLSDVLYAKLNPTDIVLEYVKDENEKVIQSKAKVTLTKQNADRLNYTTTNAEEYVFSYSFNYGGPSVKENPAVPGGYRITTHLDTLVFENEGTIHYGVYQAKRTYDYKQYTETPTAKALDAKKTKDGIDKAATEAENLVVGQRATYNTKLAEWNAVEEKRAAAANKLYGYSSGGREDVPYEGSLLYQKNEANARIASIDKFFSETGLATKVSEYVDVLNHKNFADTNLKKASEFDPEKAEGLSDVDKQMYLNVVGAANIVGAKGAITAAQETAQGYVGQVSGVLTDLDTHIQNAKDADSEITNANTKIQTAQDRLGVVSKQIKKLEELKTEAKNSLKAESVDDTNKEGKAKINAIYDDLTKRLAALIEKKFKPEDYNPLDPVASPDYEAENLKNPELLIKAISSVSGTLADAITKAAGILSGAQEKLSTAIESRQLAEMKLYGGYTALGEDGKEKFVEVEDYKENNIQYFAGETKLAADRAAKALKDWRAPEIPNNDSNAVADEDEDESAASDSASSSNDTNAGDVFVLLRSGGNATGAEADAANRGLAVVGNKIGRVLGARVAKTNSTKQNTGDTTKKEDTKQEAGGTTKNGSRSSSDHEDTNGMGIQEGVTIEEGLVAKAASPFEETTGGQSCLWLFGAGAIAAAGFVGYGIKKKAASVQQKTKK